MKNKVIHISAECYPIAKVGGLADVVGALPKYQNKLGEHSSVIMPFYDIAFTQTHKFNCIFESTVVLDDQEFAYSILTPVKSSLGFDIFLVDIPELLFKDYIYSLNDVNRFLAFQIAALDWVLTLKERPNTIHCHDHHTGLIPFMLQECYKYKILNTIPVVFTIHNAQYQGWFSYENMRLIPAFDSNKIGLLDWIGNINPLAAAIKCAWKVTTVSPSYMEELKLSANGLEALLSSEHDKCVGILNGIDDYVWDPETDKYLDTKFNVSNNISGKKANKKWLCQTFNLEENTPLFVFIGRLVHEKGSDLFPEAFNIALQNKNISILLLGSGDSETEERLEYLKWEHKGNYNNYIGYNEKLSHQIYAGADFLLMPSRVEPCGLNQMYALRYGTIPIVRSIGGLKDTIIDIGDNGFGITHRNASVEDICHAIERATEFYNNKSAFKKTRKHIMTIDHSWDNSAKQYIELYKQLNK